MYYDLVASGKRLRELREAKGMSQSALADELGIHVKTVGKAERGDTGLSVDNLLLIADFFGTTIDYLVRGSVHNEVNGKLYDFVTKLSTEQQEAAFGILERILTFPT